MNKSDGTNRVSFSVRGVKLDFDAISQALGISPTHTHRAGEPSQIKNKPFPCDQWKLSSPLAPDEPLDAHLKWLADQLRPHYTYIKSLKSPDTDVSIFWGYTTRVEQNDDSLSPEALEIFTSLGISLDFSIIAL